MNYQDHIEEFKRETPKEPVLFTKTLSCLITDGEHIVDPHDLNLELKVNGVVKQSSNTRHLMHKIPFLVEYISSFFTLEPGDIIATGTPSGVGPIQPGDIVEATVEKIGTLTNKVVLEE